MWTCSGFRARSGEPWVIEVDAARSRSKLDSFVEVLDSQGPRVERVRLQAVRDSYFAFRGKDDTQVGDFRLFNWEEMHSMNISMPTERSSSCGCTRAGRIPDSSFIPARVRGGVATTRRLCLTRWGNRATSCSRCLPEPTPSPTACRSFHSTCENDDESHRELGKDSKLTFLAPADGEYLVKIQDIRGLEGPEADWTR